MSNIPQNIGGLTFEEYKKGKRFISPEKKGNYQKFGQLIYDIDPSSISPVKSPFPQMMPSKVTEVKPPTANIYELSAKTPTSGFQSNLQVSSAQPTPNTIQQNPIIQTPVLEAPTVDPNSAISDTQKQASNESLVNKTLLDRLDDFKKERETLKYFKETTVNQKAEVEKKELKEKEAKATNDIQAHWEKISVKKVPSEHIPGPTITEKPAPKSEDVVMVEDSPTEKPVIKKEEQKVQVISDDEVQIVPNPEIKKVIIDSKTNMPEIIEVSEQKKEISPTKKSNLIPLM